MDMRIIKEISDFIFAEDKLEKADAIMVPGGSYPELPEKAAKLWHEGYAPLIIPSGRFSIKYGRFNGVKSHKDKCSKDYKTECEFYTDVLKKCKVKEECIIGEDKACYTAQNAEFSRKLLDERNIHIKKAIICCKAYHARRCLMYYELYFPDTHFLVAPVSDFESFCISKDNWYKTDIGISRVLGEVSRIGEQFKLEFNKFTNLSTS